MFKKLFEPFHEIDSKQLYLLLVTQLLVIGMFFQFFHSPVIPTPLHVLDRFVHLIVSGDFLDNLFKSFCLIVYGMGISIIIALFLSYLTTLAFFNNIIRLLCSFRYLTLTGLTFIFTMLSKDNESLRINLLLFGIIPFFTTSMLDVISKSAKQDIELGYTLKKNRWWILKEVIIIGNLHNVFEVIRSNFAICWLMITSVESVAYNLGGIGTLLLNANKHVEMDLVLALLLSVLLIGIGTDYILNFIKLKLFKYSKTL